MRCSINTLTAKAEGGDVQKSNRAAHLGLFFNAKNIKLRFFFLSVEKHEICCI